MPKIVALALSISALPAGAAPTDPYGYIAHTIPAGSQRLVGVSLADFPRFYGTVAGTTPTGLTFANDLPEDLFRGSQSAFADVRAGALAGLALTVTAFTGNELTLERSPAGLISAGDTVQVFANPTIGDLFGAENQAGLQAGGDVTTADTIGLWDTASQSSRVFYFRTGEGWREAGNEAAGDQAGATVPFPSALVIHRRAATPLTFVTLGFPPMPLEQRYFAVSPGRNLVSAPFSAVSRIADYGLHAEDSPYSILGADSAPEADTIRFSNFSAATNSEVIYYRLGHGWRIAGADGDAGDTPVELGQSMDFQRRGPAGIIRAQGIVEQTVASARALATATVPITRSIPGAGGIHLEWSGETGATYQVQSRPAGNAGWTDLGEPVTATGPDCTTFLQPTGQGFLRIVKH